MNDIADLHGQFPFSDQVLRFFSHLHLFGHIQLGAYDLYFPAMLGGEPHSAFVVSVLIFRFVENPYGNLSLRDFFILQLGKQVGQQSAILRMQHLLQLRHCHAVGNDGLSVRRFKCLFVYIVHPG